MTAHAKTCINAVQTQMRLFHQETQANALFNGPAFFPNTPSFFFSNAPSFFSHLVPYQCRLELFFNIPDLWQEQIQITSFSRAKHWSK